MRLRVLFGVLSVLGLGVYACQMVTGLSDMEEGSGEKDASAGGSSGAGGTAGTGGKPPGDGSNDVSSGGTGGKPPVDASGDGDAASGGDAGADGEPPPDAPADGDAATLANLGGTVHFLAAGPLVLGTNGGADTVTVSANGSFTFPKQFPSTDVYDVTVVTQPANQRCWVAGGKGTIGAGVTSVDVRCALVLSSVSTPSDQTTLSTTLVDMSDVAPISFTTDIASQALVTLSVPFVQGWTDGYAEYRLAIELDGAVVAESPYRTEKYALVSQTPGFVSRVLSVAAGTHTLKAKWRLVEYLYLAPKSGEGIKRLAKMPTQGTPLSTELDLVVLDSVRAFDKVLETSSTSPIAIPSNQTHLDKPVGGSLNVAAPGQASLVWMRLPRLNGADSYAKLFTDGAASAYQRRLRNDPSFSMITTFSPMIMLDGGGASHTVTGAMGLAASSATLNGGGLCYAAACQTDGGVADAGTLLDYERAAISALVWRSDAPTAYASSSTPTTVGGAGASAFLTVKTTSITLPRPAKTLLFMSASGLSVNVTNEFGEVGVFAGETRTATVLEGHGPYADAFRSQAMTAVGILDLPAGTTTLDLRARNATGSGAVTVGTSHQLNGPESFYGFGAVALE
ncbi:MAG: hypothetical protein U0263_25605 [Polyangiaceae bacterium]